MTVNCPSCMKYIDNLCTIKNIDIKDGICIHFDNPKERRSKDQLDLYWACLDLYCDHKNDDIEYNTKDKCHTQIRWAVKYINKETAVHLADSKGNSKLYFELDSISLKTSHKKANQYIIDAFKHMADELGITVEELINEAKSRMQRRI